MSYNNRDYLSIGSTSLYYFLLFFLSFILQIYTVSSTKIGYDTHKNEVDPNVLLCESCQAVILELEKQISKVSSRKNRERETAIIEIMEKICDPLNFVIYEFSPPKMQSGCLQVIGRFDEQLEKMFLEKKETKEILHKLCLESKVCDALWKENKDEL